MIDFSTAIDLTDVPVEEWRTKYIGPGYRSCCSMTDEQNNGVIVLFGYDLVGNPKTFICPHRCHIKYNVNYVTDEKDIFDNYVETRYFKNTKERKKYIDQVKDAIHIIECFSPASEFLHEMFDDVALDDNFNKQELRTFFLDIETVISSNGFEYPKTARNPINMMTIYDTLTKKYYTWMTGHVTKEFKDFEDEIKSDQIKYEISSCKDRDDVKFYTEDGNEIDTNSFDIDDYLKTNSSIKKVTHNPLGDMNKDDFITFEFDSEFFMLEHFLDWWESNYPSVICGFNSQAYDNPYIVRRIENVLGRENAKRLSPVGRYYIKKNNLDNERANKQAEILVSIDGISDADELILYRDKFECIKPLDGGYKLNNIGEAEGLGRKIEYNGSLKDLYTNDFEKFYNYNLVDVVLLKKVEEKRKLIDQARKITSYGLCNFDTIYSSLPYLIGSLSMFSKVNMNKVMISYQQTKAEKSKKYEGAYVFKILQGRYEGGIIVVDFNSLYPNTIRSVNISPETTIGHLQEDWFVVSDPNDETESFDDHPVLSETQTFHLNLKNGKLFSKVIKMQLKKLAEDNGVDIKDKKALKELGMKHNIFFNTEASVITITRDHINNLLKDFLIITRNSDLIVKHKIKRGVLPEWSAFFFNRRKGIKKEKAILEKLIYDGKITDKNELIETNTKIANLENAQLATKKMLNSIYGCIGTKFSPIFDVDLSQSITRQGKFCNKNAALYMKRFYIDEYNAPSNYINTVGGDTDSVEYSTKIYIKRV